MLFYTFAFLLVVSVIVFVHEFGHYLFAKIYGIKVEEFSVGFGKELFWITDKSGTKWKFCIIPAGGYVKMLGDSNQASAADSQFLGGASQEEKSLSLHFKPIYQKALVAFGGPLANFVFALLIFFGFYISIGKQFTKPIISSLKSHSAAGNAGILVGDKIIKINDKKIAWFEDIAKIMHTNNGEAVNVKVERDQKPISFTVKPEMLEVKDAFGNKSTVATLGIASNAIAYNRLGVFSALGYSVIEIKNIITSMLKVLGQIIVGKRDTSSLGGPLRIAKYSGQSLEMGLGFFIWFLAMLSINLGLVNLFPIPMLDGGHIAFYLAEAIKGSPLSLTTQEWSVKIGIVIVGLIFLLAIFNDVLFIFK